MAGTLKRSDQGLKATMINMLRAVMENVKGRQGRASADVGYTQTDGYLKREPKRNAKFLWLSYPSNCEDPPETEQLCDHIPVTLHTSLFLVNSLRYFIYQIYFLAK